MNYSKHINPIRSVNEQLPGQVKNDGGGYSFALDKWKRYERFLILGSIGNTFYVSEQKLTVDNIKNFQDCLKENPEKFVDILADVSINGRSNKTSPQILALAYAFAGEGRKPAERIFNNVIRTGTHLFEFVEYSQQMGGWGRGMKRVVGNWYNSKTIQHLVYQVTKYQSRNGWSNRDLLRLSHPVPSTDEHKAIYKWITQNELPDNPVIRAISMLPNATEREVIQYIKTYQLTREMIPTKFLSSPTVWTQLLETMPLHAMVRNLGAMTANETLKPLNDATNLVCKRLRDQEYILKSRLHPLDIMNAQKVYRNGAGVRGSKTWNPIPQIISALEDAFYLSFGNVTKTGKRFFYALDVSGSMEMGTVGGTQLSPAECTAAMSLALAKTEDNYHIVGFASHLVDLGITNRDTLREATQKVYKSDFGSTNVSEAIEYAINNGLKVDCFVVMTDNDINAGSQFTDLIREYRRRFNPKAKVVVIGMVSNGFTIADPNDAGMLDVVGFDTSVPRVLADFVND